MNTIRHVFEIAARPETVFGKLASADGVSAWWTTQVHGDGTVGGGRLQLAFGPFTPRLQVAEIQAPSRIRWDGAGSHAPWGEKTTISFDLRPAGGGTEVQFRHQLGDEIDAGTVAQANFYWGYYLDSLRQLCETGHGKPFDATIAGVRVGADPLTRPA